MVSRLISKNKLILPLAIIAAASQVYVFGFGANVYINIGFHLVVSYLLSYAFTFFKLKSYEENLHMKSWNALFVFMAVLLLIAFFAFPEFEGFK
ncbi:hypothetical protein DXT99_20295 [Pontibacter diazotrophicus]|uniref:Uncharacterized protein n=1 Tax=Pontibacter diazotrophicus TaxID=1400979 RepID=A0A3D8L7H3_9BACT|nr:hypothetical protein [Pontibacter diazotrophicus]RDV13361.1 hypothetical protein DXT99_20295 [Pontibacter diazotrophicus]